MERLKKYKNIIKEVLQNHLSSSNLAFPNFREQLIIDEQQQNFLLLSFGWQQDDYIYTTIFHLEIKENGQVWIHENRSDSPIEDELVLNGIAKLDLFGSMISPTKQQLFERELEMAGVSSG